MRFVHNRAFDAAYEQLTGNLMVAWARRTTSGFWFSTKPAGTNNWAPAAQVSHAPSSGVPHYLDLAAEPGGDRIACGAFDMGDGTERLGLATWIGFAWVNAAEYDSQIYNVNDTGNGDFQGNVGWVGTTGVAVCVYSDNQTGTLDWARWTSGGGWSIPTDVAIPGMGFTESTELLTFPSADRVMLVLSDDDSDIYAATYDGLTWTLTIGGVALATNLSSVDSKPFSLRLE